MSHYDYQDPPQPHPETVRHLQELNRAMGITGGGGEGASGIMLVDVPIYGDSQSDAAEPGSMDALSAAGLCNVCGQTLRMGCCNTAFSGAEPNVVAEDLVRINDSGIVPTEFKVLVLPDESETQIKARRSNIMVPDVYAAMYAHGSVTGTIIAMSPAAFSYHDWPAGCRIPLVGERIVFARFAGMLVQGKPVRNERGHDEPREYRLLNDKDVVAVLEF